MSDAETLPGAEELAARARIILEAHWQPEGYTVPNATVYPHQWLWDSCFHAIVWAHLGEGERALAELRNVFAHQADDGFVPHMTYWREPDMHADFWGRRWTSCITQPPMYGHAIAELVRRGVAVEPELIERARAGLSFFVQSRIGPKGFFIVHPWESGCDDSPAWDHLYPDGWDPTRARALKGELVRALRFDPATGSPIGSDRFEVAARGFAALVSFNNEELTSLSTAVRRNAVHKEAFGAGGSGDPSREGRARLLATVSNPSRTIESLLDVLQRRRGDVRVEGTFEEIADAAAYGGVCGPAQVRRDSPAFDPRTYWRGPAWPQLTYLFWVAARRHGSKDAEIYLRDAAIRGAVRSGFAEYWHPDTGEGFGAAPQSWTTLVAVMAAAPPL
jgi:hypothetical protein